MNIPKGPNMKIDGIDGLHAHLRELFRSKERTDYKNLSEDAKKMFESRIIEAAKKKPVGSSFTTSEKERLLHGLWKEKNEGHISEEDRKDFKKLIDSFE